MQDLLKSWKEQGHGLVDLRLPASFSSIHLIDSTNIPASEFLDRMQELPERVWFVFALLSLKKMLTKSHNIGGNISYTRVD